MMMAIQSGQEPMIRLCLQANMKCNDEDYLAISCKTMAGKNCLEELSPQIIELLLKHIQQDIDSPPGDVHAVREKQEQLPFKDFVQFSRVAD